MAYICSLTEIARGNLAQAASRKDVDLRRVLGHAILLDTLIAEHLMLKSMWDEKGFQNEVEGSEEHDCDPEDSDSDTDSDWDSDTDSDSGSDPYSGPEWHEEDFNQKIPEDFSDKGFCNDNTAYPESVEIDWHSGKWQQQNEFAAGRDEMNSSRSHMRLRNFMFSVHQSSAVADTVHADWSTVCAASLGDAKNSSDARSRLGIMILKRPSSPLGPLLGSHGEMDSST